MHAPLPLAGSPEAVRFEVPISAATLLGAPLNSADRLTGAPTTWGRYNFNKVQSAEQRMRSPTPRQLQIMELLTEKRQAAAMAEATSRGSERT